MVHVRDEDRVDVRDVLGRRGYAPERSDAGAEKGIGEEADAVYFDKNRAVPDPGNAQPFASFWHSCDWENAFFQVS